MHGDLVLVLLVIVFGCAAFLFGLVYIVGCVLGAMGRGFRSLLHPHRRVSGGCGASLRLADRPRVCPLPACGKVEPRDARFCSQCGTKLGNAGRPHETRDMTQWWLS